MDPIVSETNWNAAKFTKPHKDELKPQSSVFNRKYVDGDELKVFCYPNT
jgi:hypothetical protein